jgi:hypothetical protein
MEKYKKSPVHFGEQEIGSGNQSKLHFWVQSKGMGFSTLLGQSFEYYALPPIKMYM